MVLKEDRGNAMPIKQLSLFPQTITPTPANTSKTLPWIQVVPGVPYFTTDTGESWTPIGQNDAITWPELAGMFRRKDLAAAERYLRMLQQHGVTCLRLMLEYCQGEHRYFEKPAGRFVPAMVQLWDDVFALCEKTGMRVLLTPYDTFWMWIRWGKHPYNKRNSGPCSKRKQWLLCTATRALIKERLAFATRRWGGSGALFAWDIWNEIHPAHANESVEPFNAFIEDVSSFLRQVELEIHGRTHPQTVSLFGPVLHANIEVADCIFRHPALDFASIHFYESNTIDNPNNTIDAAISTGCLTRQCLEHTDKTRPFFDSEHGPIHAFKDKGRTLPEPFDDEYFRHMQWAHFASGGAGGGMRWPNRHPHSLTAGMRRAQQGLARFLPHIHWQQFRRKNLNEEITLSNNAFAGFCCADSTQAVLWLLRKNALDKLGMADKTATPQQVEVAIPGLSAGKYKVTVWNTEAGVATAQFSVEHHSDKPFILLGNNVVTDVAFAIQKEL